MNNHVPLENSSVAKFALTGVAPIILRHVMFRSHVTAQLVQQFNAVAAHGTSEWKAMSMNGVAMAREPGRPVKNLLTVRALV